MRLERVENDVAAMTIVEMCQVAAVGIGDDCPVAASDRTCEQLANRRRLAGAGRADELEMLGLIEGGNGNAGQGQMTSRTPQEPRRKQWTRDDSRATLVSLAPASSV